MVASVAEQQLYQLRRRLERMRSAITYQSRGHPLKDASELIGNKQVVLRVINQLKENRYHRFRYGDSLVYVADELRRDRDVVLAAVQQNGQSLWLASENLKNDKTIVLEATKTDPFAIQCASKELRCDPGFMFQITLLILGSENVLLKDRNSIPPSLWPNILVKGTNVPFYLFYLLKEMPDLLKHAGQNANSTPRRRMRKRAQLDCTGRSKWIVKRRKFCNHN